jgi:AI-2 transport protein TqsA
VRSLASALTGVLIFAFTLFAGLELATAWGIMAFTLNYIPFIGPLVATALPSLFALVQFESWQMAALIFLGSTLIQFLIGNYLEPRLFGSILDISPYLVVFAVFFWAFLWGLPGAFIGVPLTIALLTWCEAYPSTRWIATILSGQASKQTDLAS